MLPKREITTARDEAIADCGSDQLRTSDCGLRIGSNSECGIRNSEFAQAKFGSRLLAIVLALLATISAPAFASTQPQHFALHTPHSVLGTKYSGLSTQYPFNPQSAVRSPQSFTATPSIPQEPAPTADSGDRLVKAAAERMARHASVSCNVRYRVDLYSRQLAGAGSYFQSGGGDEMLLRLSLKSQLDKQVSSLLQVCDGRFLWLRRDMPERTTLGRIDLKRLRSGLAASDTAPSFDLSPLTSLGGLPRLLNSLSTQFHFSAPQAGRFRDTPVWIVQGAWWPERLAAQMPAHKEAILAGKIPWKKLPEHLPTGISLVLGRDDLFPYRLEYQRAGQGGDADSPPKSIVTLELFELRLDAAIDRSQFIYHPDNQDVVDLTESTLRRMTRSESAKEAK